MTTHPAAIPETMGPGKLALPRLGLGTWRMGESPATRKQEVHAVRHALDRGIRLIDTAEMYGEGGAEEVVGEAIRGHRDKAILVTKVYPWNASRHGTLEACERSLKRLRVDVIDLYLLHWRGEYPLADTVAAFEQLHKQGKIRGWGVSNFDTDDMKELAALDHKGHCQVNQVLYNLATRWPESSLLPWQRRTGVATMAYSPLDQGQLLNHRALKELAKEHRTGTAQIALAWLMSFPDVIAIPKSARVEGVDAIAAAADVRLSEADFARLDREFPQPGPDARMQTT